MRLPIFRFFLSCFPVLRTVNGPPAAGPSFSAEPVGYEPATGNPNNPIETFGYDSNGKESLVGMGFREPPYHADFGAKHH